MLTTVSEGFFVRIRLAKLPLCLLISCSALLGVALAPQQNYSIAIGVSFGILLLAAAGASLNCCQEHEIDATMERTRNRPLPLGLITLREGVFQGGLLALLGIMVLLLSCDGYHAAILGGLSLFLYNGVYTPLKRITVLAIIPGAICGAMPPYIGWLAGGGEPFSYSAFLLLTLFFLWQIPHFWLIVLHHRNDYQRSSLPSMIHSVGQKGLESLVLVWVLAMVVIIELIAVFFPTINTLGSGMLMAGAILLAVVFCLDLCWSHRLGYKKLFIVLNVVLLFSMLTVICGRFLV